MTRPLLIALVLMTAAVRGQDPVWKLLEVKKATAKNGTTLTVQKDGSVLAEGKSPLTDVYVIDAQVALTEVTGFRLEVLPFGKKQGPGRAKNANFVLSEVQVQASSVHTPERIRPVPIESVIANWSQDAWPATATIDGNEKTGWAISPRFGVRHVMQLEPTSPIKFAGGVHLRFTLLFPFGTQHTIGRMRFLATGAPTPLPAPGKGKEWAKTQKRINVAIDKGVEWLLASQHADGGWRQYAGGGYPSGSTALCLYALLKSGVSKEHGAIRRGIAFLDAHHPARTYSLACQILVETVLDEEDRRDRLVDLVRELISTQRRGNGGWGYPTGTVDLSNTQYAALALHMAAKRGVKISQRVWRDLADRIVLHLVPTGKSTYAPAGLSYRPKGTANGSMTAAGVGTLAICDLNLKRKHNGVVVGLKRGVAWLSRFFSVSSNPNGSMTWIYYYLYGLERAGGLTGKDRFGPHDWYRQGARWIVDHQKGSGASGHWGNAVNTCFALLFLAKATGSVTGGQASGARIFGYADAKKDVSLRLEGDRSIAMWIPRFGSDALKTFQWPGDEKKGLRVQKVEYLAARGKGMKDAQAIQIVRWDTKEPSRDNPFAARHEFPHPGAWWVRARVTLELHGLNPEEAGETQLIESDPVRITVWDVRTREHLAAGSASGRNLITRRGRPKATASSEHSAGWSAARAIDGMQSVSWLSKDNQPKPWIRIDLERPIRVDTLLLAHTKTATSRGSRILKVKVTINGKNVLGVVDMVMDDRRKTVWPFPAAKNVRALRLDVVETRVAGLKGVGFSEVELQFRNNAKPER